MGNVITLHRKRSKTRIWIDDGNARMYFNHAYNDHHISFPMKLFPKVAGEISLAFTKYKTMHKRKSKTRLDISLNDEGSEAYVWQNHEVIHIHFRSADTRIGFHENKFANIVESVALALVKFKYMRHPEDMPPDSPSS